MGPAVEEDDQVAGYLPNMPEVIAAMLATTSWDGLVLRVTRISAEG